TLSIVYFKFKQARGATLIAAGCLGLKGLVIACNFVRLVDIYYNIGLLYIL
ncbi:hypothetical protein F5883DRAFT_419206, partial [Diaporthe sp. PMI_573]